MNTWAAMVAQCAIYLMIGADRALDKDRDISLDAVSGHCGLAYELTDLAIKIETWIREHTDPRIEWPGVIYYEVFEPLGEWYIDRVIVDETGDAMAEFEQRFKEFMRQGQ